LHRLERIHLDSFLAMTLPRNAGASPRHGWNPFADLNF
jgi:hypothetical protein